MKKILGLAVLGLFGLVSYATAGPLVAPHLVHKQLRFVTHSTAITATTPGAYKDYLYNSANDAPYALDSLIVNSLTKIDTTAAISTAGWYIPQATSLDSMFVGRVIFSDAGSSGTLDSLYIAVEVSNDGLNWARAAAGTGPAVTGTFVLPGNLGSTRALKVSTGVGAGTKMFVWTFTNTQPFAGSSQYVPYSGQVFTYPLVRFIISGMRTGTIWHNIRGTISHLSADEDLNR